MDSSKGLAYLERSAKLGGNLANGLLSAVYSQGSGTRPPDGQKALPSISSSQSLSHSFGLLLSCLFEGT